MSQSKHNDDSICLKKMERLQKTPLKSIKDFLILHVWVYSVLEVVAIPKSQTCPYRDPPANLLLF